jgi:hypothetical protein
MKAPVNQGLPTGRNIHEYTIVTPLLLKQEPPHYTDDFVE